MHDEKTIEEILLDSERKKLTKLYAQIDKKLGSKAKNLMQRKGTPFEGLEVPRILIPCLSLDCSYPLDANMTAPAIHGSLASYIIKFYCTSCHRRWKNKPHITEIISEENPNSQKMITIKNYIRYHSKFIFANKKDLTSEMFYAYYRIKKSEFLKEYQPAPLKL